MISGHVVCVILKGDILPTALGLFQAFGLWSAAGSKIAGKNKVSSYVSGKLPTYPSPKPSLCPKFEASVNAGLGEW